MQHLTKQKSHRIFIHSLSLMGAFALFGVSAYANSTMNELTGLPEGSVIRSRAIMRVVVSQATGKIAVVENNGTQPPPPVTNGTQPVTVINGPFTNMSIDNSLFVVPAVSNTVLDFGFLQLSGLLDNNLNLCGPSNNAKCNTAIIRTYTTGVAGPGVYNTTDGYGVPLLAGMDPNPLQEVGLNVGGAITLQTFTIPDTRHTVKLTDFPTPKYHYQTDFSDAGAGTYTTNIVLEYALTP